MSSSGRQARKPRRSPKKDIDFTGALSRELDSKRNKGEISCAECRRLKIKCSKTVPCHACIRRGCSPLCPNGSLATGQGTRFVFEATEHLHQHVAHLKNRIQTLEQALSSVESERSSEPHPLLAELPTDEGEDDADEFASAEDSPVPHSGEAQQMDALGTLSISRHGVTRFFGTTGGTESLLIISGQSESGVAHPGLSKPSWPCTPPPGAAPLPSSPATSIASSASAIGNIPASYFDNFFLSSLQPEIDPAAHLPPVDEAVSLVATYFETVGWLFSATSKDQMEHEILPTFYSSTNCHYGNNLPSESGYIDDSAGPHALAVLYMIFAIASTVKQAHPRDMRSSSVDAAAPTGAQDSQRYYKLAQNSLSLQPLFRKPSLLTIQALYLMSVYHGMISDGEEVGHDVSDDETSMEVTWSLLSLAVQLSQTIGLHRDARRWGLPDKAVHRRQVLFWHLFTADVWQSLNTGRPPLLSLAYVDCKMPDYPDAEQQAFERWQFAFAAKCVSGVVASMAAAVPPTYATIMDLDARIREFDLPPSLTLSSDNARVCPKVCMLSHMKETVLLYLHRSSFARALVADSVNPLRSPFSHSFLTACRSASTILKCVKDQFQISPASTAKYCYMWTFAFAAAVVHATVIIRAPRSPLVPAAVEELEQACILFARAAPFTIRASRALIALKMLSDKASAVQKAIYRPDGEPISPAAEADEEPEDADELAIFAGRTFISCRLNGDMPSLTPALSQLPSGRETYANSMDIVMSDYEQDSLQGLCASLFSSVQGVPMYTAQYHAPAHSPPTHAPPIQQSNTLDHLSGDMSIPSLAGMEYWPEDHYIGPSCPPPRYTTADEDRYALFNDTTAGTDISIADFAAFSSFDFAAPVSRIGLQPPPLAALPSSYRVSDSHRLPDISGLTANTGLSELGLATQDLHSDAQWDLLV
ncbi:fungal-specific transcription factor domain-containing protein [Schizophyllum amplum]|uniref:Fungal-specific transcription factor domain-containing protein n=1 Tax=Schizophyllum amplum TaxID=97359 RepID=A0A550CRL9_9AGAR|nr:fungal-specific transcription factor domain-containing protein [Auriculariopsis ampla]